MEFHTVEVSRHETLQPYVRGTVGNRTSCAKAGPSGFSPKSTQKSGFNLRPPFTIFHYINVHLKQHATFPVKKSVREKNATVNHLHIC